MDSSYVVNSTIRLKQFLDTLAPFVARHSDDEEAVRIAVMCKDFWNACVDDLKRAKESLDYAEKCGDLKGR